MMTDGTRRTRSGRIKLVPVADRVAHEQRVESMRDHPTSVKKSRVLRLVTSDDYQDDGKRWS